MRKTKTFSELIVWQKAHQFVLNIYLLTKGFPKEELIGLTGQLRRASISIAANIAAGYSKRGQKDKMRLLNIAQGFLSECKYYMILVRDLKYAPAERQEQDFEEESTLLNAYARGIARHSQLLNLPVGRQAPNAQLL
jgi:four helix bundle protein